MIRLASAMRSRSASVGSPVMPNIFVANDVRWSKARMYSGRSYPRLMRALLGFGVGEVT